MQFKRRVIAVALHDNGPIRTKVVSVLLYCDLTPLASAILINIEHFLLKRGKCGLREIYFEVVSLGGGKMVFCLVIRGISQISVIMMTGKSTV